MNYVILKAHVKGFVRRRKGHLENVKEHERSGLEKLKELLCKNCHTSLECGKWSLNEIGV